MVVMDVTAVATADRIFSGRASFLFSAGIPVLCLDLRRWCGAVGSRCAVGSR